jgi:hypothetical protein
MIFIKEGDEYINVSELSEQRFEDFLEVIMDLACDKGLAEDVTDQQIPVPHYIDPKDLN